MELETDGIIDEGKVSLLDFTCVDEIDGLTEAEVFADKAYGTIKEDKV